MFHSIWPELEKVCCTFNKTPVSSSDSQHQEGESKVSHSNTFPMDADYIQAAKRRRDQADMDDNSEVEDISSNALWSLPDFNANTLQRRSTSSGTFRQSQSKRRKGQTPRGLSARQQITSSPLTDILEMDSEAVPSSPIRRIPQQAGIDGDLIARRKALERAREELALAKAEAELKREQKQFEMDLELAERRAVDQMEDETRQANGEWPDSIMQQEAFQMEMQRQYPHRYQ